MASHYMRTQVGKLLEEARRITQAKRAQKAEDADGEERFERMMRKLDFLLLNPTERLAVHNAIFADRHALADWMIHVCEGLTELPADMTSDAFYPLVEQYLALGTQNQLSIVCDSCRLERPHMVSKTENDGRTAYDFLPGSERCPHCGSGEWTWLTWIQQGLSKPEATATAPGVPGSN